VESNRRGGRRGVMARTKFVSKTPRELIPREECGHLVKNHAVLAYSTAKTVAICRECGGHFIVTEAGKPTRKFTLGEGLV
jgi:hypothetical protein